MNKLVLPNIYVEDPDHKMEKPELSNEVYAQAIQSMIIVCTDAVIVDMGQQAIYLAERATKPMQGLWWIGGRRFPQENALKSVRRCFKRETGHDFSDERFTFVDIAEYVWKDREQEPQDAGSHNLVYTFAVELSDVELAQARRGLEKREYHRDFGLRPFKRQDLMKAKVHRVILDVYDKIFS